MPIIKSNLRRPTSKGLNMVRPAILHVPHSSMEVPPEIRATFQLSDDALARELLVMTDSYTDEIFDVDKNLASRLIFPFSRLVVDPERFADDTMESMSTRGMGATYMRTSSGRPLRGSLNKDERNQLLKRFYWPHHGEFSEMVDASLAVFGKCLIVDCHSFSSRPLPHEPDQLLKRTEICVGTDEFHTPSDLADEATRLFRQAGFETEVNRPFSGALVPTKFYRTDPRVTSIMVEVNRGLYMNEETGERVDNFLRLQGQLQAVLNALIRTTL